jgi:hypothetical protein
MQKTCNTHSLFAQQNTEILLDIECCNCCKVVTRHEDLLQQATGIETLEGTYNVVLSLLII